MLIPVISLGQILGGEVVESKVIQTGKSFVITFKFILTGSAVYGWAPFTALYSLNNYILMGENGMGPFCYYALHFRF